jgi:AcrR family transcriptional regulator
MTSSPGQQVRREAGPLTVKGEARRAALLDAAKVVFEEKGYLDTRVADIVDEAKVAQGTFYTYFDSKDAIFHEVAGQMHDEMMAALQPDGVPATSVYDRIHRAMERFVAGYRPHARIIGLVEQAGTFTPELRALRLKTREAFVARAARGIEQMQQQGIADPELDPELTSEVLGAMVEQTCYVWLNLGKEFDEPALLHTLTVVWARGIGVELSTEDAERERQARARPAARA